MEEIRDIIDKIVKGCSKCGVDVEDVLAAFVARTIVETNESTFALDKKMNAINKEEIILQSIERLIERDNPALETMKMQVAYDSSFLKHDTDAQKTIRSYTKMITSHKTGIVEVVMEDGNDFEALTVLYRKIFRFLLDYVPNSKGAHDRQVEREVAAALESVFPRVGLKTFVQLTYEEKNSQLAELARIVLGIRLFNRDQGRGGAGIDQMDKDGQMLANQMVQDIDSEVDFFTDACNKYQQAILRGQLLRRRLAIEEEIRLSNLAKMEAEESALLRTGIVGGGGVASILSQSSASSSSAATSTASGSSASNLPLAPSEKLIDRWLKELSNRRQYLGFLRTLQDEMKALHEKVTLIVDNIREELKSVQRLVTNRASVSKEVVYPRFDSLGALWTNLYEEMTVLLARSSTFGVLCKFRLSFTPTLDEQYFAGLMKVANLPPIGRGKTDSAFSDLSWGAEEKKSHAGTSIGLSVEEKDGKEAKAGDVVGEDGIVVVGKGEAAKGSSDDAQTSAGENGTGPSADAGDKNGDPSAEDLAEQDAKALVMEIDGAELPERTAAGATLLSVHNTPDFLMLPLELQGYCPWSIVHAHGLLLPGKPTLGVVRYENTYYVCESARALKAFMEDPEHYLRSIRLRAMANPEYIHLLRLQRWFPTASIARLLEQDDYDPTTAFGRPATRDASTATPTHFVESFIDINYHWNEWELRRRALRLANLTKCATSAQQTDLSHFRRDNDAQVYEPREKGSQTKREKGTNPPIVTTYVAGLRGKPDVDQQAVSKFVSRGIKAAVGGGGAMQRDYGSSSSVGGSGGGDAKEGKARIVTLKLDL